MEHIHKGFNTESQKMKLLSLLFLSSVAVSSLGQSSTGRRFYVAFLSNTNVTEAGQLELVLTSTSDTSVSIYSPFRSDIDDRIFISANTAYRYTRLPNSLRLSAQRGVEQKGVLVEAFDADITVHIRNAKPGSTGANLVLPVASLGQRYYVTSWQPAPPTTAGSTFAVVVTEDTTRVTIDVRESGQYVRLGTFTLSRYDVWSDIEVAYDHTGTRVTADKPVAVFAGHQCAQIPDIDTSSCDMLAMQVPRAEDLGTEFLVPPMPNRQGSTGYVLRVVASENSTQVLISETSQTTSLDEGGFWSLDRSTDTSTVVNCSRPCLVAQYNKGRTADGSNSDPALTPITPFSSYAKVATFGTMQGAGDIALTNYLTIVSPQQASAGFELNGNAISPTWVESTLEGWLYANYPIPHGSYRLLNTDLEVKYAAWVQGHGAGAPYTAYAMMAMSGEKDTGPSTTPGVTTPIDITTPTGPPVSTTQPPVTGINTTYITGFSGTSPGPTGPTAPPTITPPTFHIIKNATFQTVDGTDISIDCSYQYSERLEYAAEQMKRNLQNLIPGTLCGNQIRFFCSREDKVIVVAGSTSLVTITFMFDVDMGRTPLETHACSAEVASYISNMNNWQQPLIPSIPGCRNVVWTPNRWDTRRRRWNCGAD